MFSLQSLRKASWIGRLILAWLLLATAAALASPLVKPPTIGMICSSSGSSAVVLSSDSGDQAPAGLTLDCPLCTSLCAPPPATRQTAAALPASTRLACPLSTPRATASCAAALPARGPPDLS
ncbi:hypothetical protein LBMAG30_03220 [Comamonadaceae bacterium]|nr:hypothetical protein LBMAG30_03220 [Comamonadaceae bacterium]